MTTILKATAALALLAAPAFGQDLGNIQADVSEKTQPVLNGTLDLGGEVMFNPSSVGGSVDVGALAGETTVEVSDQIDSVNGKVLATATNVTHQVNNGDLRSVAAVGVNAGNRAADITAAAIGNSLSVVNGISQ